MRKLIICRTTLALGELMVRSISPKATAVCRELGLTVVAVPKEIPVAPCVSGWYDFAVLAPGETTADCFTAEDLGVYLLSLS